MKTLVAGLNELNVQLAPTLQTGYWYPNSTIPMSLWNQLSASEQDTVLTGGNVIHYSSIYPNGIIIGPDSDYHLV